MLVVPPPEPEVCAKRIGQRVLRRIAFRPEETQPLSPAGSARFFISDLFGPLFHRNKVYALFHSIRFCPITPFHRESSKLTMRSFVQSPVSMVLSPLPVPPAFPPFPPLSAAIESQLQSIGKGRSRSISACPRHSLVGKKRRGERKQQDRVGADSRRAGSGGRRATKGGPRRTQGAPPAAP